MAARRHERGFTLLETIVALAILASFMAALYQGLARNWWGISRVRYDAVALEIARAQFASLGLSAPLADGQVLSGANAGVAWTIRVEKYAPAEVRDGDTLPEAYWLVFDARLDNGAFRPSRTVHLRTLKLGRAQ